ncbi:MAG: NAD(P)-dependent oxidoreductase, partial [Bacteroidota bacterium]
MKNIVVLDGYTLNPGDLDWSSIENYGNLTIYDRSTESEIFERCKDAEIIITNKCKLEEKLLNQLPKLEYIAVSATGYNIVDIKAAKEKNIFVSNVPGYGTGAVAQHVFAMILTITNRIAANVSTVNKGKWANHLDWCYWEYPITAVEDKILGIVGFGAIGQRVAKIGRALGMQVIVNDRSPEKKEPAGAKFVDLATVFQESDFLTLHCPLTP